MVWYDEKCFIETYCEIGNLDDFRYNFYDVYGPNIFRVSLRAFRPF